LILIQLSLYMPAYIQKISTFTPQNTYRQDVIREKMKLLIADNEVQRRVIHTIYSRSGIQTRHSVLRDFHDTETPELYFNGHGFTPGTASRNKLYEKYGRIHFVETARRTISENSRVSAKDITHLITISCTGFYAPGPDYDIITQLGLKPSTERYHIGFMGCYAAITGLKLAYRICAASKYANVLLIANELCTLHFQGGNEMDDLISASVFADGSAGVIVSSAEPEHGLYFEVCDFATEILNEGSDDMAWTIGDTGFNMVLSSYIPDILSNNLNQFLQPVLSRFQLDQQDIDIWAIHPGGRSILDRVEKQLDLNDDALNYSRHILSEFGNMSSATILYVLKEILEDPGKADERLNVFAMAFGPGITIESGYFIRHQKLNSRTLSDH
jgi:predicted naringenin-chalcone synthase